MTSNKNKNQCLRNFFLVSLALHAVIIFYPGRSVFQKRFERRIEVDLKYLASNKPIRNIPRPYRRPKVSPEVREIKTPVKSLIPKPVLSYTRVKHSLDQKTASAEAIEKILIPLSNYLKQASVGVVDQIRAVSLFQVPSKINVAYNTFDQTMAYQGAIRRHIEGHKRYPPFAVKKGLEGSVDIRFLLHSNGQVKHIEIAKSSQIALLDEAAVRAVRAGNPFPPFPESISQDSMVIEVTLNFELHRRFY